MGFPSGFHGNSASKLGQEILDHNFGERLQALQFELEVQGAKWGLGPRAGLATRGPASTGISRRAPKCLSIIHPTINKALST
ncbi:MAG: hypothetical protein ACK5P7_09345 [Bdellovibrio sp.]|jgi:hypothetical protein